MVVVDASVLVAFFVGDEPRVEAARELLFGDRTLWAPHLVDAEVGHAIRRATSAGLVHADVARASLEDLALLPLERVSHSRLMLGAWEMRENVSFYDGLYVALAQMLAAPLITLDGRLARAAGRLVPIVLLGAE